MPTYHNSQVIPNYVPFQSNSVKQSLPCPIAFSHECVRRKKSWACTVNKARLAEKSKYSIFFNFVDVLYNLPKNLLSLYCADTDIFFAVPSYAKIKQTINSLHIY